MIHPLTLDVVCDVQHSTFPTDASHRVGVLYVTHKQLVAIEHPCSIVNYLTRTNKPRAADPRVTAEIHIRMMSL